MPSRKQPKVFRMGEVLRFILNHPLNRHQKARALARFLRWQVGSRMAPGPVIIPFVDRLHLIASPGMMGATGIYYTGLYEYEEMAFTLHALRPDDRFIDVGAHIGAFSVLAAGAVGAKCLAIEPVPTSFAHLMDNVNLNGLSDKVQCLNLGIASTPGHLRFTTERGAANAVLAHSPNKDLSLHTPCVDVEVQPLDALTAGFTPALLKVDVEGYESEVVAGGEKTLADDRLLAILIELRGHGSRYGFDENAIHQHLLELGFLPYSYSPLPLGKGPGEKRTLIPLSGINLAAGTTLYVRNLELIRQRLADAPPHSVLGQTI